MAEYIDREKAKRLLHIEYAYAAEQLLDEIPAAEAVSLHDIYRVIAGHSYYHGDCILAALSCIVEGKEVNPVRPADVAPVVRCKDCKHYRNHPNGLCYLHTEPKENARGHSGNAVCVEPEDFCSYGERKEGADNG